MRWPTPLSAFRQAELSVAEKAQQISLGLVLLIVAIGCVGFAMLYSANKSLEPWALRQMIRFAIGIVIMFAVAAVLTPPDIISQLALAIPTLLLYEASIIAVQMVEKKRAADAASTTE